MRCGLAIVVSLWVLPALAGAQPPRFICPREIGVSPVWLDRGALFVHIAVLHRDRDRPKELSHDGKTYVVSAGLPERLEEDFGPFAPLALRRIEVRLQQLTGPHRSPRVARAVMHAVGHVQKHLPYRVRPHVNMLYNTELWVHRLARQLRRRRGHTLTITSGTRSPEKQAAAMFGKLVRRGRYRRLYKKRELAEEIRQAFRAARRKGKRRREIIAAMAQVIEDQIRRGCYVSAHLKRVAVDVRSYDMIRRVKRTFRRLAEGMEGMKLLPEERRPPHFHLEVPATAVVPTCPHLEVHQPEEAEACEDPPPGG